MVSGRPGKRKVTQCVIRRRCCSALPKGLALDMLRLHEGAEIITVAKADPSKCAGCPWNRLLTAHWRRIMKRTRTLIAGVVAGVALAVAARHLCPTVRRHGPRLWSRNGHGTRSRTDGRGRSRGDGRGSPERPEGAAEDHRSAGNRVAEPSPPRRNSRRRACRRCAPRCRRAREPLRNEWRSARQPCSSAPPGWRR